MVAATGEYHEQDAWILNEGLVKAVYAALGRHETPRDVFATLARDGVGLRVPLTEKQSATDYVRFFGYINEARESFFNLPYGMDIVSSAYQQRAGYYDTLDFDEMKRKHVPFAVYGFGLMNSLVPEGELESLRQELQAAIKKDQTGRVESYTKVPFKLMNEARAVVVGGDIFVITLDTHRVTEVIRNWMNYYEGDLALVRAFEFYNRGAEREPKEPEPAAREKIAPTDALRNTNLGAETPAYIPGGRVVNPEAVWRSILAGMEGRGNRPYVLEAIENEDGLPTALDLSFAALGGNYQDAIQSRLARTMQDMGAAKDAMLVTYCHSNECWLSYNLALRLIHLGYSNVVWMRDGADGWIKAGLPLGFARKLQ